MYLYMIVAVVSGLLKYWPKTHSPKEVMFLNELEEVMTSYYDDDDDVINYDDSFRFLM
jgi:hypothetical protein